MRPLKLLFLFVLVFIVPLQLHSSNSIQNKNNPVDIFYGKDKIYEFKVVQGLFKRIGPDLYYCNLYDAFIIFHLNITFRFDESGFFHKSDLVKHYKKGILTTLLTEKENWFALSGFNKKKDIVYYKGYYEELLSMQGRDSGEPSWLWSRSGVIEIRYPEKFKKELDPIVNSVNKSFKFDINATF